MCCGRLWLGSESADPLSGRSPLQSTAPVSRTGTALCGCSPFAVSLEFRCVCKAYDAKCFAQCFCPLKEAALMSQRFVSPSLPPPSVTVAEHAVFRCLSCKCRCKNMSEPHIRINMDKLSEPQFRAGPRNNINSLIKCCQSFRTSDLE